MSRCPTRQEISAPAIVRAETTDACVHMVWLELVRRPRTPSQPELTARARCPRSSVYQVVHRLHRLEVRQSLLDAQ